MSGVHALLGGLKARAATCGRACVERGTHPAWFGYRWVRHETVHAYFARHGPGAAAGCFATVHPETVATNPLPRNVTSREELIDEKGWWGFSFRDVPSRPSGETFMATLPDCRVAWYRDAELGDDFFPAILSKDGSALDLRELRFRPPHANVLRRSGPSLRLARATWIVERVYHNYSHWVTAHLPKLLLARNAGAGDAIVLPPERMPAMDASIRALGFDPGVLPTFDVGRPLRVDELTIIGTDRFRPELLRLVPEYLRLHEVGPPWRKIYVSRRRAGRRRLVNEEALWALLASVGFERVEMEALTFTDQLRLMRETAVLCGLHGAGLANLLFCPPGAHLVEIADPGFPNPNFYALAAALGHHYWILHGSPVEPDAALSSATGASPGEWRTRNETRRPGWRNLHVDVGAVRSILANLSAPPFGAVAAGARRG